MKRITSFVTSLALALTQIIMPMPFTPNAYAVMDIGVDQSLAILSVLDVTPGTALEFQGPKGGPFQPTGSDYYTLKNSGDLPLNWTANDSLGWADLTPSQGTLAPAESIMVTVSINKTANGLTFSQSSFSNDVYFTNLSTSQSVVRQVILSTGSMAMAMAAAVPNFWIAPVAGIWSNASNWELLHVPNSGEIATFDPIKSNLNCTIDVPPNIAGLEMKPAYTGTVTQNSGQTATIGSSGFITSSGTFNSNASITVNGDVQLNGGTLNLGPASHTVSGNWINNGATVTAGASAVTFNAAPGATITIQPGTVNGDFNNITFTNPGGAQTFYNLAASPNQLVARGNLTISGAAQVKPAFANSIYVYGNWTNNVGLAGFNDTTASSTVVLKGTSPTVSGSTTFRNLTMLDDNNNNLDSTLTFEQSSQQTIAGTLTLQGGDSSDKILIRSTSLTGTVASLKVTGTHNIKYVNPQDSNACPEITGPCSGQKLKAYNSTPGTNLSNWDFGKTISGTATQITNAAAPIGTWVRIRVNGGDSYSAQTGAGGVWSVPYVQSSAGDTITIYADTTDTWVRANIVTISDGISTNPISGLQLYGARITVRSDNGANPIRIADMVDYDSTSGGANMLFDAVLGSPNTLTTPDTSLDKSLFITAGDTFKPEGTVTLADGDRVWIEGTLTMEANNFTVGGRWEVQPTGIVTTPTNTVTLTGTGGGWIRSNNQPLYNLIISGLPYLLTGFNLSVLNDLTLNGGSLDTSATNYSLTVNGNLILSGTGTLTANASVVKVAKSFTVPNTANRFVAGTSTVELTGTGTLTSGTTNPFYNLTFPNTGFTTTLATDIQVNNALTFRNGNVLGSVAGIDIFYYGAQFTIQNPSIAALMSNLTLWLKEGQNVPAALGYAGLKLEGNTVQNFNAVVNGAVSQITASGSIELYNKADFHQNAINVTASSIKIGTLSSDTAPARRWYTDTGNLTVWGNVDLNPGSRADNSTNGKAEFYGGTGNTIYVQGLIADQCTAFATCPVAGNCCPESVVYGNSSTITHRGNDWNGAASSTNLFRFRFEAGTNSTVILQRLSGIGTANLECRGGVGNNNPKPFYNLTLQGGGASNRLYRLANGGGGLSTLTVNGLFKMEAWAKFDNGSGGGNVFFKGNFDIAGASSDANAFDTSGYGVQFLGSAGGPYTINTGGKNFDAGGATTILIGSSTINANHKLINFPLQTSVLKIINGLLDLNGNNLTINLNDGNTATKELYLEEVDANSDGIPEYAGTLRMKGTETISPANVDRSTDKGTVEYGGGGNITVTGLAYGLIYHNLTFSDGGTPAPTRWNLNAGVTVNGQLNLNPYGGTLDLGSYSHSVLSGSWINNGVIIIPSASTVTLTAPAAASINANSQAFNNLTLSGAGPFTLMNSLTINGNLIISAGTPLNTNAANSYPITVGGNWNNSGTFTANSSTVTLNGTNQTITGSTTFKNLTMIDINDNLNSTLTFTAAAVAQQNITGFLKLWGNDSTDDMIQIRSTIPGTKAKINVTGSHDIRFVNVQDSNACPGTPPTCSGQRLQPRNSVDSGNNFNWNFGENLSGWAYKADGITKITSGTVAVSINGSFFYTTAIQGDGSWVMNNIQTLPGDTATFYFTNSPVPMPGNEKANVVVAIVNGDLQTNISLIQNKVIVQSEFAGGIPLRIADMVYYDSDQNNPDMLFDAEAGTLSVETGVELFIPSAHVFTPEGSILQVTNITLGGMLDMTGGGNIEVVSGNWTTQSTGYFVPSTSTVRFSGTSSINNSITPSFYNITFAGGTTTLTDPVGDLNISGTLRFETVGIVDGTLAGKGILATTVNHSGTSIVIDDQNAPNTMTNLTLHITNGQNLPASQGYARLELDQANGIFGLLGNIKCSDYLNLQGGTLNQNTRSVIAGALILGGFEGYDTTWNTGNGNLAVNGHLMMSVMSGSFTFNAGSSQIYIGGDLTVADFSVPAWFQAQSSTITLAGNLIVSNFGSFVAGTSTLILAASSSPRTLNTTGALNNLILSDALGIDPTYALGSAVTVNGDFKIENGASLDMKTFSITFKKNFDIAGATNFITNGRDISFAKNGGAYTIDTKGIDLGASRVTFTNSGAFGSNTLINNPLHSDFVTVSSGELDLNGQSMIVDKDLLLDGSGTLRLGSVTHSIGGNWTAAGAASLYSDFSTVAFNGTSGQTISTGNRSFFKMDVNKNSGSVTVLDILRVTGTLSVTKGTLDASGNFLTVATLSLPDNALSKLRLWGNETLTITNRALDSGTVEYGGGALVSNSLSYGDNYWNVIFDDAASTWTLAGNLDVGNDFKIKNGIVNLGSGRHNVGGTWTSTGGIVNPDTSTVVFDAPLGTIAVPAEPSPGKNFFNLVFEDPDGGAVPTFETSAALPFLVANSVTVQNSALLKLKNNLDVNGDVIITSGAKINNIAGRQIRVAGDWTNNVGAAGFVDTAGQVILNGVTQKLGGSTTFNHLEKIGSGTLTFQAGSTQTITGLATLIANGLSTDEMLSLTTDTPGTPWNIIVPGSYDLLQVAIKNGNALASPSAPLTVIDGYDAGGNTGFVFGAAAAACGGSLCGTLKRTNGTAIVGACVEARRTPNSTGVPGSALPNSLCNTASATTDASGNWSISSVNTASSTITIYLHTLSGKPWKSNAVIVGPSTNVAISGIDLVENQILVRSESASPVTNYNFDRWDGANSSYMLFNLIPTGTKYLYMDNGTTFYINAGNTYQPQATEALGDIQNIIIDGTLDLSLAGSKNLFIYNDWTVNASGNFIPAGGLVTFSFTSGSDRKITNNGAAAYDFYNIMFRNNGIFHLETDMSVENNLTLDGTTSNTLTTRNFANNQNFNLSVGNPLIAGSGDINIPTGLCKFIANSSTISVGGDFIVGNTAGSFVAGTSTVDLTGTGTLSSPANDPFNLKLAASGKTTTLTGNVSTWGRLEFKGGAISASAPRTIFQWGLPTVIASTTILPASPNFLTLYIGKGQAVPGYLGYGNLTLYDLFTQFTAQGDITCLGNLTLDLGYFKQQLKSLTVSGLTSVGQTSSFQWDTESGNADLKDLNVGAKANMNVASNVFRAQNITFSSPLAGAAFNAGASNIYVTKDWNNALAFPFTAQTSTVTFEGTTTNNITSGGKSFYNVKVNGTSTKLADALKADAHLDIQAGIFDSQSKAITVAGHWNQTGGTFMAGTGTVTLNSPTASTLFIKPGASPINNFKDLVLTGQGRYELKNHLYVDGNLTFQSSAVLDTKDSVSGIVYNVNVKGDWLNNQSSDTNFVPQTSTVTLTGTLQTVKGNNKFYNFTKIKAGDTLKFEASKLQTVLKKLTLKGSVGSLLYLDSTVLGTQWKLKVDPTCGTNTDCFDINYVDVQDSDASPGKSIYHTNTTNSGNNINWFSTVFTWTGADLTNPSDWTKPANWTSVPASPDYPRGVDDKAVINSTSSIIETPATPLTIGALETSGTFSGTLHLNAPLSVKTGGVQGGVASIQQGTVDISGFGLTVEGSFNLNGNATFILKGDETITLPTGFTTLGGNSTVIYKGNGISIPIPGLAMGNTYGNIIFNSSTGIGGWTLQNNLSVNGDFTINSGTVDPNGKTLEFYGDFTLTAPGVFLSNSLSTLKFLGTGTISSNLPTELTFPNLYFGSASNITLATNVYAYLFGNLTFDGGTINGSNLSLYAVTPNITINPLTTMNSLHLIFAVDASIPAFNGYSHLGIDCWQNCSGLTGVFHLSGNIQCKDSFAINEGLFFQDGHSLTVTNGYAAMGMLGVATLIWNWDTSDGTAIIGGAINITNGNLYFSANFPKFDAFKANDSVITVSGDVVGSYGNVGIEAGLSLFKVGGNWLNSDGLNNEVLWFYGQNSIVEFNGTGPQRILSELDPDPAYPHFNTVRINKPTGTATLEKDLYVDGDLELMSGTFDANNKVIKLKKDWKYIGGTFVPGTSTVRLEGTGDQVVTTGGQSFATLAIDKTSGLAFLTDILTANTLSLTKGTFYSAGNNLTVQNVTFSSDPTAKLKLHGNEVIPGTAALDATKGTVEYGGGGAAVNSTGLSYRNAYWNLKFNDSLSTWNLTGNVDAGNNLDMLAGTVNLGSGTHNVGGTWTSSGGIVNPDTSTVVFDAPAGTISIPTGPSPGKNFYNLIFDGPNVGPGATFETSLTLPFLVGNNLTVQNSARLKLRNNLDVNGSVTTNSSGAIDNIGAANINVAGDWTNNVGAAGFIDTAGKVILDATDGLTQRLSGSTTFNHLEKTNYGTLTFQAGSTQKITGLATLLLQGTDTDNMLTLQSDTPTQQWFLDITGSYSLQYVIVSDGNATNLIYSDTNPISVIDSFDGGNNAAMAFGATVSGTVRRADGSPLTGISVNVIVRVNGGSPLPNSTGQATNSANGTWSIPSVTTNPGDTVTVYIKNATYKGNVIILASGSSNITGVDLTDQQITIRSDYGTNPVTNNDLDKFDANKPVCLPSTTTCADKVYMLFTVGPSGSNKYLTTNNGSTLYINAGDTLKPTATEQINSLCNIVIDGTLDMSTSAIKNFQISNGNWTVNASGNYIPASGKVTFSSNGTQKIATLGTVGPDFYDLNLQSPLNTGRYYLESDLTVQRDLTISNGIGTLDTKNQAGTQIFNVVVGNDLTLPVGGGKLVANSSTISVGRNFTVATPAGSFDKGTSTIDMSGNGSISSPNDNFYSLKLAPSGATTTLTHNITVNNTLEFKGGATSGAFTITQLGASTLISSTTSMPGLTLYLKKGQIVPAYDGYHQLKLNGLVAEPFTSGGTIKCSSGLILEVGRFLQQGFAVDTLATDLTMGTLGSTQWDTGGGQVTTTNFVLGSNAVFNAENSNITLNNIVFPAPGSGRFNAGLSAITVKGNWDNTTGFTFNADDSTVIFSSVPADRFITSGGKVFKNVKINSPAPAWGAKLQDAMIITGNFDMLSGYLDVQTFPINLAGNWTETGGDFRPQLGTVTLNSPSDQNIRLNGDHFHHVESNKATGEVVLADAFFADGNVTVTKGTFYSNGQNLTIAGALNLPSDTLSRLRLHGGETVTIAAKDVNSGVVEYGGATVDTSVLGYGSEYWILAFNNALSTWHLPSGFTVHKEIRLNAGTVDLSSFTHTIEGPWVNTGVTIIPGSSTVVFNGASTPISITSRTQPFYDLTFAGAGKNYQLQDALLVHHNLTVPSVTSLDANAFPVEFASENQAEVAADGVTFANLTVGKLTNGGLKIVGNSLNIFGLLTIASGTLDVNGKSLTATGFENSGILKRQGEGTEVVALPQDLNSGTWIYQGNGSGTLGIKDFGAGSDYFYLIIDAANGVETFSISANLQVVNELNVVKGTLGLGNKTLRTLNELNITGGTLEALNASLDLQGPTLITAGVFNAPSGTFPLKHNFRHLGGSFNHNGGTVEFTDSALNSLTESAGITFFNLKCVTPNKRILFAANSSVTVENSFIMKGTDVNGLQVGPYESTTAVHLETANPSPAVWNLILNGTKDVDYVDVRGSHASGSAVPLVPDPNVHYRFNNGGNNENWFTGRLRNTGVALNDYDAGAASVGTVAFDLSSTLPSDGKIVVKFPAGFNISGITTVSGISPSLTGTLIIESITGQAISLRRSGGTPTPPATSVYFNLSFVTNPTITGLTGNFIIETRNSVNLLLDTDPTVASVTVTPAPATTFIVIHSPLSVQAGVSSTVTVDVRDIFNNRVTDYNGKIHFTSNNDPLITVPADYLFTAADQGLHTFTNEVVFRQTGNDRWIKATDIALDGLGVDGVFGEHTGLTVRPAAIDHFTVEPDSNVQTAGTPFNVTITAKDIFNNTILDYNTRAASETFTFDMLGAGNAPDGTVPVLDSLSAGNFVNGIAIRSSTLYEAVTGVNITFRITAVSANVTNNSSSMPITTVNPALVHHIAFTTQPSTNVMAGVNLTTQPVVKIRDRYENIRIADTDQITLAAVLASDTSTLGGGLLNATTNPLNALAGVASFSGVNYTRAEAIKLKASMVGVADIFSTTVSVIPAAIHHFTVEPDSNVQTAGTPFNVTITAKDIFNNTILDYDVRAALETFTLLINGASNAPNGTAPIIELLDANDFVNGVATRSSTLFKAVTGANITFEATANTASITDDSSALPIITVDPAAIDHIAFTTQPSATVSAGLDLATQPIVKIRDQYNNIRLANTDQITLEAVLASDTSVLGGGILNAGSNPLNTLAGVATFSGVNYTKAEDIKLKASMTGVADIFSTTVSVIPAAIHHFTVEPDSNVQTAGTPFNVTITAYDNLDNVITDYASRASGNTFAFTTTANVSPDGTAPLLDMLVATNFTNGIAVKSATLYKAVTSASITFTVTESGNNKSGTTSLTPIATVNPAIVNHIAFTTQPSTNVMAGVNLTTQPVVKIRDRYENIRISNTDAITLTAVLASDTSVLGGGLLNATTNPLNALAGVASFSGVNYTKAEDIKLKASMTGVTNIFSDPITVIPAAIHHFTVEPSRATQTAGTPFNVTITAKDIFNNTILDYNTRAASETFTFDMLGAGNAPNNTAPLLDSLSAVNFVNGIATRSATLYKAITGATITFSVTANNSTKTGNSSLLPVTTVNPALVHHIVFTTQPSPNVTAGVNLLIQPVVKIRDQYENIRISNTDAITLTAVLASDTSVLGGGSLSVTSLNAVTGVAAFSGVNYTKAENIKLKASMTGVTDIFSDPITVIPAAIHHFTVEPSAAVQTAGIAFGVEITALDMFNNIIIDYASRASGDDFTFITSATSSPDGTPPLLGTLAASDFGVTGVAIKSVALYKAITQASITFTVTKDGSNKSGVTTQNPITTVNAAPADAIEVKGITTPLTLGIPSNVIVVMHDNFGNEAPGYAGNVSFDSPAPNADPLATLPMPLAWNAEITRTFTNAIVFGTWGLRTVEVSAPGLISGSQTVLVNRAPTAKDDGTFSTDEDKSIFIDVLINDFDAELNPLTVISVTQPSRGTVTIGSGGLNVSYMPEENYHGPDSFTYKISDGVIGGIDEATVAVAVLPINDPPVATNDIIGIPENGSIAIAVLANDVDVDNDPLSIISITQPSHGNSTLNTGAGTITFASEKNFDGTVMFSYTISDGKGGTHSATVTVNVSNNNTPPNAKDDSIAIKVNSIENSLDVLANDTDAEKNDLQIVEVSEALHGHVEIDTSSLFLIYSPKAGFAGKDQFTYTISDGFDKSTAAVNISVTVPAGSTGAFGSGVGGVIGGVEETGEPALPEGPVSRLAEMPGTPLPVIGASYTSPQVLVFGPNEKPDEKLAPASKLVEYIPFLWNESEPAKEEEKEISKAKVQKINEKENILYTPIQPFHKSTQEKEKDKVKPSTLSTDSSSAAQHQKSFPESKALEKNSFLSKAFSFFNSIRLAAGFGIGNGINHLKRKS